MNRHLTSDLGELWGVLPYRRKVNGVEPGMKNKFVNSTEETEDELESRWVYPNKNLTPHQIRLIAGRVCEIALRALFENFSYQYGGETFLQLEVGPHRRTGDHGGSTPSHADLGRGVHEHPH